MSSIYSRKRIKIPKLNFFYSNKRSPKKFLNIILILVIAIVTIYMLIKSVVPIFEKKCIDEAINIAVEAMNDETNKVLADYDYTNLLKTEANETDGTNILRTDVATLNKITTELPLAINRRFSDLKEQKISIPAGAFTGSKYLSGMGPDINIKIISVGNITNEVRTEFESKGINQTIYRIYLELNGEVSILTPYNSLNEKVTNKVLLVETVIVGGVPETYLNLDKELNKLNLNE